MEVSMYEQVAARIFQDPEYEHVDVNNALIKIIAQMLKSEEERQIEEICDQLFNTGEEIC